MENKVLETSTSQEEEKIVLKPDYKSEILKIIRSNASPKVMCDQLDDYHENDIADVLPALSSAERKKLYRILDLDMLSGIFEYTDEQDAGRYLDEMDLKKAAAVLSRMEADAAVEILRELEKNKRALLIELLDVKVRKDIALIASFDDDEIGSKMTTNCIIIHKDLSVKQAMS